MSKNRLIAGAAAGAMTLVAVAGAIPAQAGEVAAKATTRTAIDKGGAFCWQFGSTAPGATRNVLSLDIDASDHPTKLPLWMVGGVEKATNADVDSENYVNNLMGSITLAKPNERAAGPKLLQVGLNGTGYGTNAGSADSGIWNIDYTLQLNRKSLKGKIVGVLTFTPVAGTTAGTPVTFAVNDTVKPINCTKL